jgi:vacuolar-type H+-ATPase subunit E/Vma4
MSEEIKGLIEKIQREGIQKAKDEGKKIEERAQLEAKNIIEKALADADLIIQKAKEYSLKEKESTQASLEQAGRDFLISIRAKLNDLLKKIIVSNISESLTPQEMSRIINTLIKERSAKPGQEGIEIIFNKTDLAKIKELFLEKLSEEAKKGITLKSSENLSAGFTISFDSGKSHFDFSDKALAQYLSTYLNQELAKIFK